MGAQQPTVARMEIGKRPPTLDLLARYARALGKRLEVRFAEE